jgi:ABC-type phosphate transport system substrate-binding protein
MWHIKRFITLLALLILTSFSSIAESVTVIAHTTVTSSVLTTAELRRIYTMRQITWSDNVPIVVFVLPSNHLIHQTFCKQVLKLFPYQLDRIWHKLTYSGVGVAPIEVNSLQEMLSAIQNTPGAIGYVESSIELSNVRVIEIKE